MDCHGPCLRSTLGASGFFGGNALASRFDTASVRIRNYSNATHRRPARESKPLAGPATPRAAPPDAGSALVLNLRKRGHGVSSLRGPLHRAPFAKVRKEKGGAGCWLNIARGSACR